MKNIFWLFSIVFVLGMSSQMLFANVPNELIYEGQIFDNTNAPITTEHSIRISLWKSNDFIPTDIDVNGAINFSATNYGGWTEVQSFLPAFNGSFSIELGKVIPMPVVDFENQKFFQIEIKPLGASDTEYELLDPTGDNGLDLEDRQKIGSVLYAKNAQKLENSSIGTEAGNIAVLQSGGKFLESQIGGGTDEDIFVLDHNDDSIGNIFLQFGNTLNKNLFWNTISSWFEFDDTLKINGDLILTGTLTQGDKNISESFSPRYENAVFDGDGSDNIGSMRESKEIISGNKKNILTWISRKTTLQDYSIEILYKIPENFKEFQTNAFSFEYKTSGTSNDSKIDFQIEKEGILGNQVLGSTGDNISNNTFTETNFSLISSTVWNPGDTVLISIKPYSRNLNAVLLGDLKINMIE